MNRKINFLIIIPFLSLICFSSYSQTQKEKYDHIDSLELKLQNWRMDSLGCLGFRNRTFFEFWEKLHHYVEKDSVLSLILLGRPNEIKRARNQVEYFYHFATKCKGNSIDEALAPNYLIIVYRNDNTFIGISNENH